MHEYSDNVSRKISELRLESSRKKVIASRYYLKGRTLKKKSVRLSLRIADLQGEVDRLIRRKNYFESKATALEGRIAGDPSPESVRRGIEQRRRKALELLEKIRVYEKKMGDEKEKVEGYEKTAQEWLKKSEEAAAESKKLEMDAVELELKMGIRRK